MLLDFTSLLLAAAFSGMCLSLTMFAFWLSARSESFLVTWAAGLVVVVGHVFAYWVYVQEPDPFTGTFVVALLPVGTAIIYAAARQFVSGASPVRPALRLSAPYLLVVLPLMGLRLDGVALIIQNAATAALLVAAGAIYWRNRAEAPVSMAVLSMLYVVVGTSFALCGLALLQAAQWSIGHAPDNWAERINIVVSVACMTGMGALSLSLNQARLAGRHRAASLTDPLSGLLNRRALINLHGARPLRSDDAVVMFDLDHFKRTNDAHGHAVGDEVIRRFAAAATKHSRPRDEVFRMGGEEFALLLPGVSAARARAIAGRVAEAFRADTVATERGLVVSTVSAGIGFGDGEAGLEDVLARADQALYEAKRAGRDRVIATPLRMAV